MPPTTTTSPVRLNHAVLFVGELERSVAFYADALGMEVVARMAGGAAFLRLPRSGNHHDLGLFQTAAPAHPRRRGEVGLYHLAWQVDTIDDLVAMRRVLTELGSLTGESDHGATKSLYGVDPDGHELEVMWMLPPQAWGDHEHTAVVAPLDLDVELQRWRGVRTAVPEPPG